MKKLVSLLLAAMMLLTIGTSLAEDTSISADLTMWTGTWNDGKMEELLAEFQKTYPNINVTFEYNPWDGMEDKYLASMMSGTMPDIIDMAIAWCIPYAKMGYLINVDELAEKHGIDLEETYYEGSLETGLVDGKHYAIPYRTEVMTIIYNKEIFEKAGLDPEKAPETWADVVEYGKAITALGDGIYGFGLCGYGSGNCTAQVYTLMFSNGVELLNEDQTAAAFNTPEGVEALQFWADMYLKEGIVPSSCLENDNTTNRNLFAEGKLGMYMSASYDLEAIYEANPDIQLGFSTVPVFSDKYPAKAQASGWDLGITTACEEAERDAAFLFSAWLTNAENAVVFSDTLSANRGSATDPSYTSGDLKPFVDALEYGKPVPGNINMNAITDIIYNESQAVLAGMKDAATALADAEAQVNDLLAQ